MSDSSSPDSSSSSSAGRPLLREAIIAAICLCLGALALPAAIFAVGTLLLGPYTGGLGKFYQSFLQDLLAGVLRTWSLVLGPYLVIMLLRAIFLRRRALQTDEESPDTEVRRAPPPEQVRTTVRSAAPRRPAPPSVGTNPGPSNQTARSASKRIEPRISLD